MLLAALFFGVLLEASRLLGPCFAIELGGGTAYAFWLPTFAAQTVWRCHLSNSFDIEKTA